MRITFTLLFLTALACAQGIDKARLGQIGPRMQGFVDRHMVAGVVTLVTHNGETVHVNAVGQQNREEGKAMAPDTIFQIMSMTKPVTGVAVMMMAEEGKLNLTDPVEHHLPEFKGQMLREASTGGMIKPRRPVTVRDLMTHTSGLPTNPGKDLFEDAYQKMKIPLGEAVKLFAKNSLDFEPGTKWQYSNMGIATLGRLVEVTSGMSFEDFVQARIFEPLGMKDSHFFLPAAKRSRLAMIYRAQEGALQRADPKTLLAGDPAYYRQEAKFSAPEFGLYSTAADMAAFYNMMLNGGASRGKRLLSRAAVETMSTVHTGELAAGPAGAGFGLTWEVVRDPMAQLTLRSKGSYGHGGAFGTYGLIDPHRKLVCVFLVQSTGGGSNYARDAFVTMAESAVLD
jgi:CubicO group peptidase (beta-lactamase class C family)